jgi:hypothetical protein
MRSTRGLSITAETGLPPSAGATERAIVPELSIDSPLVSMVRGASSA